MKTIGVNLWSLMPMTFNFQKPDYELYKAVADMGIEYIDFIEDYIPCHPRPDYPEIGRVKKRVSEYGLKIGQVWFYTDILGGAYLTSRQHMADQLQDFLYVASEMEARFMCISLVLNSPGRSMEECHLPYIDMLTQVLPIAEKLDIPIALEYGRPGLPEMALRMVKEVQSKYLTLTPDFEAWRIATEDIPLAHVESQGTVSEPEPIELFYEALPYSRNIHAKLLAFDENGEEPHFPIADFMRAINNSSADHHLSIEYEGWIPDINPQLDCLKETRKGVDLLKSYLI